MGHDTEILAKSLEVNFLAITIPTSTERKAAFTSKYRCPKHGKVSFIVSSRSISWNKKSLFCENIPNIIWQLLI